MKTKPNAQHLLNVFDSIIAKNPNIDKALLDDLLYFRNELEQASIRGEWLEFANIALKVSMLIKFICDRIPPPT